MWDKIHFDPDFAGVAECGFDNERTAPVFSLTAEWHDVTCPDCQQVALLYYVTPDSPSQTWCRPCLAADSLEDLIMSAKPIDFHAFCDEEVRPHCEEIEDLRHENERLIEGLRQIREMVDRQAEDEGLWFITVTASEAYLQQELRSLHDRVERVFPT